jgi:NitT/TauT family transport system permease protein
MVSSVQKQFTRQRTPSPPAPAQPVRLTGWQRAGRVLWSCAPVLTFAALIGLWALIVPVFDIPPYLLPSPGEVIPRIWNDRALLWTNSQVTLSEIAAGFALSTVTAIPLGLLIALSRPAKRLVYPPVVFVQLIPKIAIAPLFLVWFGFGMESKVVLTLLMTFFPLLLASISGFQILDDRLLHLTRSMGATRWQTFLHLRFPSALPVIFSGLKASATMAATAAIVAEFVGANEGLGYVLLRGTSNLDTQLIFAVLFALTVIGLLVNYVVEALEYVLTPWQRRNR